MRGSIAALCAWVLLLPATALAWSPLRAKNPSIEEGNQAMAEARYDAALEHYDTAARELPESYEVQLNRGLALLAQELTEPAKEALTRAADPAASESTRAAAYYNLGIAFARQGEALSEEESFEESSSHFREAAQAFKQSLRQQPGNRDAAWNLEYVLQRIQEEEERREEQQEEQEQSQDQDQDQDQEQNQDQDQDQDQDQEQNQDQDQDQDQDQNQDQNQNQNQNQDQEQNQNQNQDQEQNQDQAEPRQPSIPESEVERFLDALEQNEESLPLQRARRRNAGRRPPEKDW